MSVHYQKILKKTFLRGCGSQRTYMNFNFSYVLLISDLENEVPLGRTMKSIVVDAYFCMNSPCFSETIIPALALFFANFHDFDHVIFSFHGLPTRQVDKVYLNGLCDEKQCDEKITRENHLCYKATSYETAKQLAQRLNIEEAKYTVSFQSRLDNKWIKPYSDEIVKKRAQMGDKKLLIFKIVKLE